MERTYGGVPDVAATLGRVGEALFGGELPVRLEAWDGSSHGPVDAPSVVLRAPAALRALLWHPGELGLAHAYATGDLTIRGDVADVLHRLRTAARAEPAPSRTALAKAFPRALLQAAPRAVRLPAPRRSHRLSVERRATDRDGGPADVPVWVLDAWHLAYTTGVWTAETATLEQAQTAMLENACRTLRLRPDSWLLDLGCGRGALSVFAAHEYGARVTAMAPTPPQATVARDRAERAGLADRLEVMPRGAIDRAYFLDHHGPYDAVAALDLTEYVPDDAFAAYARAVHRALVPGGRALLATVSRPAGQGPPPGSPPVESLLAPEMQPRPIGGTLAHLERAGLEILAVHAAGGNHVRTLSAWRERLEERWADVTALTGEDTARAWRLHLAGSELTFTARHATMHQVVARRPG
jgi:cyclopropane-fatty-acyl-phospholipid synthase